MTEFIHDVWEFYGDIVRAQPGLSLVFILAAWLAGYAIGNIREEPKK